jgi:hypothetical protein
MAHQDRNAAHALILRLMEKPYAYDFFAAVRRVEVSKNGAPRARARPTPPRRPRSASARNPRSPSRPPPSTPTTPGSRTQPDRCRSTSWALRPARPAPPPPHRVRPRPRPERTRQDTSSASSTSSTTARIACSTGRGPSTTRRSRSTAIARTPTPTASAPTSPAFRSASLEKPSAAATPCPTSPSSTSPAGSPAVQTARGDRRDPLGLFRHALPGRGVRGPVDRHPRGRTALRIGGKPSIGTPRLHRDRRRAHWDCSQKFRVRLGPLRSSTTTGSSRGPDLREPRRLGPPAHRLRARLGSQAHPQERRRPRHPARRGRPIPALDAGRTTRAEALRVDPDDLVLRAPDELTWCRLPEAPARFSWSHRIERTPRGRRRTPRRRIRHGRDQPQGLFGKFNSLCYKASEAATVFCKMRGNPHVEVLHFFHQVLQLQDSDLHRIIRHFNLNPSTSRRTHRPRSTNSPAGRQPLGFFVGLRGSHRAGVDLRDALLQRIEHPLGAHRRRHPQDQGPAPHAHRDQRRVRESQGRGPDRRHGRRSWAIRRGPARRQGRLASRRRGRARRGLRRDVPRPDGQGRGPQAVLQGPDRGGPHRQDRSDRRARRRDRRSSTS